MKYIDLHSHIQMREFDRDRDAVLSRCEDEGVGAIVVGVDYGSSRDAVALAETHDFLWATVGLHPHDNLHEVFDAGAYRVLARHPKVVAIGECGLDYSRIMKHESGIMEKQKNKFKEQIEIALELGKPLMLHVRDSYEDVLNILNSYFILHNSKLRGNVHFFVGTFAIAEQFFAFGFTVSLTGVITFTT